MGPRKGGFLLRAGYVLFLSGLAAVAVTSTITLHVALSAEREATENPGAEAEQLQRLQMWRSRVYGPRIAGLAAGTAGLVLIIIGKVISRDRFKTHSSLDSLVKQRCADSEKDSGGAGTKSPGDKEENQT